MIARNCLGLYVLHLLCHDAHIKGVIAALVSEAIEFETVVQSRERDNVLLEINIGASPTTAAAASATASTTTTAAATAADMYSPTSTADMVPAAACASYVWSTAARPREIASAAIAETSLAALREILGPGTIANIEGIASSTALCLYLRLREICLLPLPSAPFEPLLNLSNIRLGLRPLAKIRTSWLANTLANVQHLLALTATVRLCGSSASITAGFR